MMQLQKYRMSNCKRCKSKGNVTLCHIALWFNIVKVFLDFFLGMKMFTYLIRNAD